jgi:ATP-dependent DNA ligase
MIAADGSVELLSRTGKTWGNFETVRKAVAELAQKANFPKPYVLDGEVVSLDTEGKVNFQQIQRTMHRKDGIEVGRLQYVVFDGCELKEWMNPQKTYQLRLHELTKELSWVHPNEMPAAIRLVESFERTYTKANATEACKTFMTKGYEGAMFRKAGAVVENKRSKNLLKVKLFQDSEAEIIGAVEGTGKYKGMLGALQCRLKSGKEFEIGSGYDDAMRKEMWAEKPIGKLSSFKFFELTDDGIPRFPIFKGIRHPDDVGEED